MALLPCNCGWFLRVDDPKILRIVAVESPAVANDYLMRQHQHGYAQMSEWSRAVPTSTPNEVMQILTKRVAIAS